jgi:hypothetical protein
MYLFLYLSCNPTDMNGNTAMKADVSIEKRAISGGAPGNAATIIGNEDLAHPNMGCWPIFEWRTKKLLQQGKNILIKTEITGQVTDGPYIVDIIEENGESHWGFVCDGPDIQTEVPPRLGRLRLAVFEDSDSNGPSTNDPQALSDLIDFDAQEEITISIALRVGFPIQQYGEDRPPPESKEEPDSTSGFSPPGVKAATDASISPSNENKEIPKGLFPPETVPKGEMEHGDISQGEVAPGAPTSAPELPPIDVE